MNKTVRNSGLIALGIAVLAIPVAIIARNMMRRRREEEGSAENGLHAASIFPAYRGKQRPHNRKSHTNGHIGGSAN